VLAERLLAGEELECVVVGDGSRPLSLPLLKNLVEQD